MVVYKHQTSQSFPITATFATLIPVYGNVYKIQYCVIKFVSDIENNLRSTQYKRQFVQSTELFGHTH